MTLRGHRTRRGRRWCCTGGTAGASGTCRATRPSPSAGPTRSAGPCWPLSSAGGLWGVLSGWVVSALSCATRCGADGPDPPPETSYFYVGPNGNLMLLRSMYDRSHERKPKSTRGPKKNEMQKPKTTRGPKKNEKQRPKSMRGPRKMRCRSQKPREVPKKIKSRDQKAR